jgi:hypothetical protein
LRGHVERCSNNGFEEGILALHTFRKAKIADFALISPEEDIGWLQITVNDAIIVEVLDALHDLLQEVNGFILTEPPLLLEVVVEIIVAELGNDVHVVIGLEDIVEVDNVLMTHLLHDLDLGVEVLEVEVTGEDALIDNFHSHWFSRLDDLAAVDRGVGTLSEEPFQVELVFLDSFLGLHGLTFNLL